jgi:hypothetical protein
MSRTLRRLSVGVLVAVFALSGQAWAADGVEAARAEYDQGAADLEAGRFTSAVEHFAKADELAPNPLALELALRATLRSDSAVLAMTLADRADARRVQPALARQVRARFAPQTGRVVVRCPESVACTARIDGRSMQPESPQWVTAGAHELELSFGEHVERNTIRVGPGATIDVRPFAAGDSAASRPAPVVTPEKPTERPTPTTTRPVPASVYVLGATALVGFGVWGYSGLSGLYGKPGVSSMKECRPYCSQKDADSVSQKLLISDIGFGVAAVATVAAIWLFATRPRVPVVPEAAVVNHGFVAGVSWSR